ncbi:hypothetical protein H5410_008227 [Solanum commersonii]|uniref:Uncharacterized protein n=1 Tax=Solanum commersonii TaxID=4109 RepID=A0A9J6AF35_SOLCO|nr:hypothetical protein H5410_008227 [Solanum commersonii]
MALTPFMKPTSLGKKSDKAQAAKQVRLATDSSEMHQKMARQRWWMKSPSSQGVRYFHKLLNEEGRHCVELIWRLATLGLWHRGRNARTMRFRGFWKKYGQAYRNVNCQFNVIFKTERCLDKWKGSTIVPL